MKRRLLVTLLSVSTLLMAMVFIIGFGSAVRIGQDSGKSDIDTFDDPVTEINGEGDVVLVLGDSIGTGMGDEDAQGIGNRYLALLDREERNRLSVENFAESGSETSDLLDILTSGSADLAIQNASLIIISIGGNNLNRINEPAAALELASYEQVLADHRRDLDASITYIRQLNERAAILLLGLYNPYGNRTDDQRLRLLHRWNFESRESLTNVENTRMVPLYDLYEGHLDTLLSVDRFHPSAKGYEVIAETIYRIVEE